MLRLLLVVLPIALLDGLSPVRIGTVVVLLGAGRPWKRVCLFIFGSFLGYLLLGIVVATSADELIDLLAAEPRPVVYGAGIVIGALLVFLGARNLGAGLKASPVAAPEDSSPGGVFLLSLVQTAVTAPAALPYLAAIDLILQAEVGIFQLLGALSLYCLVYIVPMTALMMVRSAAGSRSADLLARIHRVVSTSAPRVVAVLLLVLGLLMLAEGVAFFLGRPFFPTPKGWGTEPVSDTLHFAFDSLTAGGDQEFERTAASDHGNLGAR